MAGRTRFASLLLLLLVPGLAGCLHDDNAWALRATGIAALLGDGVSGRAIRVAILDTGVDPDVPSLRHLSDGDPANGELVAYADFVGEEGGPRDGDGHGTFVAGVLAGAKGSGLARLRPGPVVPGGAPHVDLLVARVSQGDQGSIRALAGAIEWALDQHADVISLSLGIAPAALAAQPEIRDRLVELLARAESDGVLVVAAAGNHGPVPFPADQPTVLAVGAVDKDLRPVVPRAGGKPDVCAPGRDVTGPWAGGDLVGMDGTSAAVPFVAAAGALLMAAGGDPATSDGVAGLRDAIVGGAVSAGPHACLLQADRALPLYLASG